MRKKLKLAAVLGGIGFMSLVFTGCALLPYSSNYSCPETKSDMGNCSSLVTNYKESFNLNKIRKPKKINCPVSLKGTKACEEYGDSNANTNKRATTAKPEGFISMRRANLKYFYSKTPSPLRVPSSVKKILVLPYYSGKVFYGEQSVFVIVKKGHWLYGQYFNRLKKRYMFKIIMGE
ncbi:MAG: TraV family lipoprotein [bacterium]